MSDFVRTQKRVIARPGKACAWNDQMPGSGIKANRSSSAASAALLTAVMCAALAPATFAQAPFVRIAKTGDPVSGMPGFTWDDVGLPAIDAAGNVALRNSMDGPGVDTGNDQGIFHGRPGNLGLVVREGDFFPQFGDGVYQRAFSPPAVAQTGQISYEARLDGPGIERTEDDILWAGTPDSRQVVAREGQTPPGITDGGVYSGTFGSALGRSGHTAFRAGVLRPDGSEYSGLWSGTPDDPRLVTYSGAPAPGTEPGVTFPSSGVLVPSWTVNARGAMAFPAALEGPGINGTNGAGIWAGTADDLVLVMRAGDPVPLSEPNARFAGRPDPALINGNDRVLFPAFITGDGITQANDRGLWAASTSASPELIIREGDEVPVLGAAYTVSGFTSFLQTEDDRVLVAPSFAGPGVTPDNDEAIFFGNPGNWELIFREGDKAPGLPDGVVFEFTNRIKEITITDTGAAGMLLPLGGSGVTEANDEALFWRRSAVAPWQLVAREGELFDGSIIGDGGLNISVSGGGEGLRPSINDHGHLAFVVRFEGDEAGAYVIPEPGLGSIALFNLTIVIRKRGRPVVGRYG